MLPAAGITMLMGGQTRTHHHVLTHGIPRLVPVSRPEVATFTFNSISRSNPGPSHVRGGRLAC